MIESAPGYFRAVLLLAHHHAPRLATKTASSGVLSVHWGAWHVFLLCVIIFAAAMLVRAIFSSPKKSS